MVLNKRNPARNTALEAVRAGMGDDLVLPCPHTGCTEVREGREREVREERERQSVCVRERERREKKRSKARHNVIDDIRRLAC